MTKLREDDTLIERLENDLIKKAVAALNAHGIESVVHGVFSLDDLESKTEKELDGLLAVGIGYQGCSNKGRPAHNPTQGNAAAMLEMFFTVMFAVPVDQVCSQRYTATKVLTVLRNGIVGQFVESAERTQRAWEFVQEKPETGESTETMLYYTQLWRLPMPLTGN